jgi:hypothetical protein
MTSVSCAFFVKAEWLAPLVVVRSFAPQVVSAWLTTVSLIPCIVPANGPV